MLKSVSRFFIAFSVFSTSSSFAITETETVYVSATRSTQTEVVTPQNIIVITADDIQDSGATSIVEVLNSVSSIQLFDATGNGKSPGISMRGFGENSASNTLVMVDGRRLTNATLQGPEIGTISIHDIERIEIIEGSAATLYGDKAVSGVINVITKSSSTDRRSLTIEKGTEQYRNLAFSLSGPVNEDIEMRLSAQHSASDNYRDNNETVFFNTSGHLRYKLEHGHIYVESQHTKDELNLAGAITEAQLTEDREQSLNNTDFFNQDTETFRAGAFSEINEQWDTQIDLSQRTNEADTTNQGFNYQQTLEVLTASPKIVGVIPLRGKNLLITSGIDFTQSNFEASWGSDSKQTTEAVYAQGVLAIEEWSFTTGVRHSRVSDKNKISDTEFDENANAAQLGALYSTSKFRFHARTEHNFRFGTIDEQGYILPTLSYLKPQTGVSSEIGLTVFDDNYEISLSPYQLDLENEIIYDASANSFFGANVNLDDTERQGATLAIKLFPKQKFQSGLSYTATKAEFTDGTNKGNKVPFVAEEKASVNLSYQVNKIKFRSEAIYTGPRFAVSDKGNTGKEYGGYTTYNLSATCQKNELFFGLKANNVTNKKYDLYTVNYGFGANHYPAALSNIVATVGFEL